MNHRDKALIFFVVLGTLIELGLFFAFMDLSMRGRATTLWEFAVWPFLFFPFLSGWLFFSRKWKVLTWFLFLGATSYCVWYQLSAYGWALFEGSMWVIGLGHVLIVALLIWTLLWYSRLKERFD
ncbi:MAG: hypothetical protein ABI599_14100 [Flavobacteriales bacterium]